MCSDHELTISSFIVHSFIRYLKICLSFCGDLFPDSNFLEIQSHFRVISDSPPHSTTGVSMRAFMQYEMIHFHYLGSGENVHAVLKSGSLIGYLQYNIVYRVATILNKADLVWVGFIEKIKQPVQTILILAFTQSIYPSHYKRSNIMVQYLNQSLNC